MHCSAAAGGGALGAYQACVYEALAEAKLHPDWVAGISVGAINSALIAGNPPDARADRLRQFWEHITDPSTAHAGAILFYGKLARMNGHHARGC